MIRSAAGTHPGLKRKRNEDSHYLGRNLAVVADGMGGHVSGDIASQTVIDAVRSFDRPQEPAMLAATLSQAVYVANIGDSRAYVVRGGRLRRITDDHTYARLVSNPGRVPHLDERISRFLDGRDDGRSPDLAPVPVRAGDRLLLCSDGLSSYVGHGVIQRVAGIVDPQAAVEALIHEALEVGAPDNVTVVIIDA
jgi:serine/threonine protein phosphatase PrpC